MLSIALHLIMAAMLGIYFSESTPQIINKETSVLSSYLYFSKISLNAPTIQTNTTSPSKKLRPIINKTNKNHSLIYQAKPVKNESFAHATHLAHQQPTSLRSVERNELLLLLHNAIQKTQQYPTNAMEMEREGRVTVEFTLYPNGTILNLHLLHSSGTNSLDEAALAAIRQATPFQGVNQYLNTKHTFSIDIIFAL